LKSGTWTGLMITLLLQACGNPADLDWGYWRRDLPQSIPPPPRVVERPGEAADSPKALIYIGQSTWLAEVDSIEDSLVALGYGYKEVVAEDLVRFTEADWSHYLLLIVAGGYAPLISQEIPSDIRAQIQKRVRAEQLNYLGFCAGAWLAVSPSFPGFEDGRYGFGFLDGPISQPGPPALSGQEFSLVDALLQSGARRKLLWWGGPIAPEVSGAGGTVIARYPEGGAAISRVKVGRNWITLSGLHPTANASILGAIGINSPESAASDLTAELIQLSVAEPPLNGF